jgi:hypothetical protein
MADQLYPDRDPITGLEFFMLIEHPDKGMVPTYGGPFDSYTIPERDLDDSTDEEVYYMRERYDHDEGAWVEGYECLGVVLIAEERLNKLENQCDECLKIKSEEK